MNLLELIGTEDVIKTDLSRKLTLGGVTKAYPVYRVSLDKVFYNDQNDRIATWITQYKNEKGKDAFSSLQKDQLNDVIENFIIQSNPMAIEKTKNNINLVGQREPGVVLADGRIVDGNRRFACLRLLHKNDSTINYFETVILDTSIENSEKQIKMLELAIQHGEEQRVDYNQIDLAIGAYRDILETELLTINEYAESTNESISDVKKRLEIAKLIVEFLEYMNVPEQYHIAREMQVYSIFLELVPLLRKVDTLEEQQRLKKSVFNNLMMGSFADHRRYIRNVKAMLESGFYSSYMREQDKISAAIEEKKSSMIITTKADIDSFVKNNEDIVEDLQMSMDKSLLKSKKKQTKEKPAQIVNKSISMLKDIDTRIFNKLDTDEKERLKVQLEKLSSAVNIIEGEVKADEPVILKQEDIKRPYCAFRHDDEPLVFVKSSNQIITNLVVNITLSAIKTSASQKSSVKYLAYFIDEQNERLTEQKEINISVDEDVKLNISLNAKVSALNNCFLVLKSENDEFNEAQQVIKYKVNMSFVSDFDF